MRIAGETSKREVYGGRRYFGAVVVQVSLLNFPKSIIALSTLQNNNKKQYSRKEGIILTLKKLQHWFSFHFENGAGSGLFLHHFAPAPFNSSTLSLVYAFTMPQPSQFPFHQTLHLHPSPPTFHP